jgi:hypothetical protein
LHACLSISADGSGGIDLLEFIKAVRVDAKFDDSIITDRELEQVRHFCIRTYGLRVLPACPPASHVTRTQI